MRGFAIAVLAVAVAALIAWPLPSPSSTNPKASPPGAPASTTARTSDPRPNVASLHASAFPGATSSNGSRGWVPLDLSGPPSVVRYPAIADDPALGGAVLFGGMSWNTHINESPPPGVPLNDTWEYAQGAWTELCNMSAKPPTCALAPPARIGPSMAYDPALGAIVLFGGCDPAGFPCLNDTWTFWSGRWANVTPVYPTSSNNPPAQAIGPMAYDAADGYLLLFGSDGSTWKYDANGWSNLNPVASPLARYGEALFYDPQSSAVILFGGAEPGDDTLFNDTWSFHAGNWTQLAPASSPAAGTPIGSDYDTLTHTEVVFGVWDPAGHHDQNYTWTWANGSWTNETANFGAPPPAVGSVPMAFDSTDGVTVLLTPIPPRGLTSSTWVLRSPLTLTVNATASVVDVGEALSYGVAASGGVQAYRLAISSLPPGCPLRGHAPTVIPCLPTASGSYKVNFTLMDRSGLASWVTLPLRVNVDPLATLSVLPNPTTVGVPVVFGASYVGGTGAITARWTFGDGTGFVGNSSTHTYARPGTYLARLSGVDAAGFAFDSNQTVTVDFGVHAVASVNRNVTDVGVPVSFRASGYGGTGSLAFSWNFGDGGTSTLSQVAYSFASVGGYEPRLYANDSVGAGATANLSVMVNPLPTAELFANASIVPADSRVAFSAVVAGGTPPMNYGWVFPDGTVSGSSNTSHLFVQVGTFTVRLFVHDAVGGTVANSTTVRVTAAPNSSMPGSSNTSAGPPILVGVGAVAVGGAVAAAVALYASSRRRKVRRMER